MQRIDNRLELVPVAYPASSGPGGLFTEARHFLDLVVDGRSLRERIDGAIDTVTPMCSEWVRPEVLRSIDRLLGRAVSSGEGLDPHDVAILVCPACGDLDCGAVVARVEASGQTVTWSDFRWIGAGDPGPEDAIDSLGPRLTFARDDYEFALLDAVRRIDALSGGPPSTGRPVRRRRWWRRR